MVYTPFLPQLCTHGGDKADISFTLGTFLSTLGQDPWFSYLLKQKNETWDCRPLCVCVLCAHMCTYIHEYRRLHTYTMGQVGNQRMISGVRLCFPSCVRQGLFVAHCCHCLASWCQASGTSGFLCPPSILLQELWDCLHRILLGSAL